MREFDYDPTIRMTREEAIANPQPVCVLADADGEPQGVLVQALGERFVIEPKNFNDGKEMKWEEAMDALKEANRTTFNSRKANIALCLADEINDALRSIEGDSLPDHCWTRTEHGSFSAFGANFAIGCLQIIRRGCTGVVREIIDYLTLTNK